MPDHLLKQYRDQIDQIDQQMLMLLNQRAQCAQQIGSLKGSGVVYRPEREVQVLTAVQDANPGPLTDMAIKRLFREIMSECLALERPLTIAYLGPAGTFTERAAIKHFGQAAQTVPCTSIEDAFRMVEERQADYGVAPVENSTEGAVGLTLDRVQDSPLKICGEVILRIQHQFLRKVDTQAGIERVYAHAQTLAQCQNWLKLALPAHVEKIPVVSNAEAARLASEEETSAAIAGASAAQQFGLYTLAANIEDRSDNTTRFWVLGHQDAGRSGKDKTSIVVSAPNQAGAVYSLLQPIAQNSVSMSKLESRPAHTGLWEYVFFIDLLGHRLDPSVKKALEELQACASFVKVLGSYPVAVL